MVHLYIKFHKVAKGISSTRSSSLSQTHWEAVMSAAWPRYIILSGYGIATRHLIKEYRGEEWKERNMDCGDTEKTKHRQRKQKQGGSQREMGERLTDSRMFDRK